MAMATPIHDPDQGDYRLAQQCGADAVSAENVAVSYRLDGPDRPIERIGSGWSEFGLEAGTVLAGSEDVEGVRQLLAGRDPHTGQQLVKPKLATAPEAMLAAAPFVAALQAAATEAGVPVADAWSAKRVGRLQRGLTRDGEHHRAPVADLSRVAASAGIDPRRVYGRPQWKKAWDQRHARVQTGVMGYDVTFDRPKGISVLQGLAPADVAERMERIHLEAVRESVAALQTWTGYAMSGHHGDGQTAQRLDTSGLIGTMTVHRTARPVDGQPGDPHLHTHVMLSNLARGEDGRWRTIAAGGRDLMRHIPAVGELYRALERDKLTRELGITFERDAATGRWDVAGVPDELKTAFSRRQQQIQTTAGTGATPAQARTAARATARAKVASTPASERASWRERTQNAGHEPDQVVAEALGRGPGPGPTAGSSPGGPDQGPLTPQELTEAVWDPEHGVTAHTKVVTSAKVMAHVAGLLGRGLPNAGMLEVLTDHVLTHGPARALPPSGPGHMSNAERYTSDDLVAAEETITASARRRLRERTGAVHLKTIMRAERAWERKKGFRLSRKQRRVVRRLTWMPHGIDTVVGVAGSGKTTIMSAARTIWESAGYRVEGAANAAVAAAGLRAEAGIDSSTVASLLHRIETGRGLAGVDVLVLDEAATVDDRALATLVAEAARTRTKLVGIGDPLQARAVKAGGSFARVHEIVKGQVLDENRRQRQEVDRTALETWRQGARRSALALWGEHGMIHAAADTDAAHRQITASWAADRRRYADPHQAIESLAVLAATNADVEALNACLRGAARAEGHLAGEDTSFALAGGHSLELAAGDQVRVRRNDYRTRHGGQVDVLNGFRGVIVQADQRRGALVQWRHGGRTEQAWIDPDRISQGALSHGYAITVASAQGLTVDRAHVHGLGADAHTLYPAMSRARQRVDLYLPAAEIEPHQVRARLGQARTDEEALHRVISAYASTLTDGPEGMVLDELAGGPQERQERERAVTERAEQAGVAARAVTPWQPLTLDQANAGHGPAARQAEPEIADLSQRQAQVDQHLPELFGRVQEAEERADQSRLVLLWQGTTRTQARAERDAARAEVDSANTEREHLRAQARQMREQALAADRAQAQADRERAQRETVVAQLEQGAPTQGRTRGELREMETEELSRVRTRQVLQACAPGRRAPTHEDRIRVPAAPEPSQADQAAEMARPGVGVEEYQRRIAREIEAEDQQRRDQAERERAEHREALQQQHRELAQRAQHEAATQQAHQAGPEL